MSTPPNPTPMATPYGTLPVASPLPQRKPVSLPRLNEMRERGEKIAMLTSYDATFAAVADAAGVECILVGDSLGMVCQGLASTAGVTLETMAYHVESVARGLRRVQGTAWLLGDLPFGSYHESKEQAMRSAAQLVHAGAHMIKLEGGGWTAETTRFLVERGIPVCAHLGLTPQAVNLLGGYKVQGRQEAQARQMRADAMVLEQAGAAMLLLECVPSELAAEISQAVRIPVIGIGAGGATDGQVLVLHDMLGLSLSGRTPKFVKDFMAGQNGIPAALAAYVSAVKERSFPAAEHGFSA